MWQQMKPYTALIAVMVAAVALAGCAGMAQPDVTEAPEVEATAEPPVPTSEPEPTTEPEPTSEPEQPTVEATGEAAAEPTVEPPHASANVVYFAADGTTLMSYNTGTGESWPHSGVNYPLEFPMPSPVTSFDTNVYGLARMDDDAPLQVFEITPVQTRALELDVEGEPRAIAVAVAPGSPDIRLAVGAINITEGPFMSSLLLQTVDAPEGELIAEQTGDLIWYAPVRWSEDGQRLYYSQEPMGIGGYILFSGWSSLFVYDVAAQTSTPLIPFDVATFGICLDDLSPDAQWVAHHCEPEAGITLVKVAADEPDVVIAPPEEIAGEVGQLGSARFSPDGSRIGYALARGVPESEQGWVAVTDDLTGSSRLLLTGEPNTYYNVMGWADDQTLVVQQYGAAGGSASDTAVWLVPVGGGEPVMIGEGHFVTVIPPLE